MKNNQPPKKRQSMNAKRRSKGISIMGSYTISVVEDNEATKEAHFEKDGNWIDLNHPSNKDKEALTHIPLETYKFKGWE